MHWKNTNTDIDNRNFDVWYMLQTAFGYNLFTHSEFRQGTRSPRRSHQKYFNLFVLRCMYTNVLYVRMCRAKPNNRKDDGFICVVLYISVSLHLNTKIISTRAMATVSYTNTGQHCLYTKEFYGILFSTNTQIKMVCIATNSMATLSNRYQWSRHTRLHRNISFMLK